METNPTESKNPTNLFPLVLAMLVALLITVTALFLYRLWSNRTACACNGIAERAAGDYRLIGSNMWLN